MKSISNDALSLALALGIVSASAPAQVMEKKSLTLDRSRKVIAAAVAEAKRANAPGGVNAVVDDGGNLMRALPHAAEYSRHTALIAGASEAHGL